MLEKNVRKIVSKTNNYPFKCFLTRFEITFFPRTVMQKVRLGLHMERVRLRFVVVTVKREIFFFIFQNSRDLDKHSSSQISKQGNSIWKRANLLKNIFIHLYLICQVFAIIIFTHLYLVCKILPNNLHLVENYLHFFSTHIRNWSPKCFHKSGRLTHFFVPTSQNFDLKNA